jgi:hypothetical protein
MVAMTASRRSRYANPYTLATFVTPARLRDEAEIRPRRAPTFRIRLLAGANVTPMRL